MNAAPLTRRLYQRTKSLHRKKERYEQGKYLLPGEKLVEELYLNDASSLCYLVADEHYAQRMRSKLSRFSCPLYTVSQAKLTALSAMEYNQTLLAVAHLPKRPLVPTPLKGKWLVLDDLQDPGNLGALLRTAAWYGIAGLVCSPQTVDVYNSKVLRGSMGTFLHVPIYYTSLGPFLQKQTLPILAAMMEGENVHHLTLPSEGLLIIGNEAHGIRKELLHYATNQVSIPKLGSGSSLNATVAAAILCDRWSTT